MFHRILVPLDGSLRAERALPIAARIARASQGMLVLLRVVATAPEDEIHATAEAPLLRTAVQNGTVSEKLLVARRESQTLLVCRIDT